MVLTVARMVCAGLGRMPAASTLKGITQISNCLAEAETTAATTLTGRGDFPGSSSLPATASVAALMANLPPRPMLAWPRPQRECT